MGRPLRCPCGVTVDAPAEAKLMVCAACNRTLAVEPDPSGTGIALSETLAVGAPSASRIALSETIPAFVASTKTVKPDEPAPSSERSAAAIQGAERPDGAPRPRPRPRPSRRPTTNHGKPRTRWLPHVIYAVVATGLAVGIVMYAKQQRPPQPAQSVTSAAPPVAVDAAPPPPSIESAVVQGPDKLSTSALLAQQLRAAIGRGSRAELEPLFDPAAFGIGIDASHVAADRGATIELLLKAVGRTPPSGLRVSSTFSRVGTAAGAAWFADEILVGDTPGRRFVMTYLAVERPAGWKIAAIHFALAVPNKLAFDLAKAELLPEPVAIDNAPRAADLDAAFREAFASRPALVKAFSDRLDAYNRGSAPNENAIGGPAIKGAFNRMSSEIHIQDGVTVGSATSDVGWGAANIAFTMTIDSELATQIFRVLAIFVKEPTGWKIVSAHWSNAGPIVTPPPVPKPSAPPDTTPSP